MSDPLADSTPCDPPARPANFSMLLWVRDEGETPVYRVMKDKIKAASTATVLARKLQREKS